jgi:cytoskeletal protein RodZ
MKWKTKAIAGRTNVGEQLKKAREVKGLTLYRISTVYHIPKTFLKAVEANRFGLLPDTVYTKGMLKKYLRILGLSDSEYLPLWEEAHAHWKALEETTISEKEIASARKPHQRWFITPTFLQKGFVVILALLLLMYIGIRLNNALAPAELTVFSPTDEMTTTESSINVTGKTEPEVQIKINNFLVTVDEDGSFQEEINLTNGLNILEIEASKKYRPVQTTLRHILLINPNDTN